MSEPTLTPKTLKTIMSEFDFDTGNTMYNDEFVNLLDTVSGLPEGDRIIICLYAHYQSLRKTAKVLGVSYATMRKSVGGIREKIRGMTAKPILDDEEDEEE